MRLVKQLPPPLLEEYEWQERGLCRRLDVALFFDDDGDRRREAAAKRVCRRCPVSDRCLAHALRVGEEYGIWGGLTAAERDKLRHGLAS